MEVIYRDRVMKQQTGMASSRSDPGVVFMILMKLLCVFLVWECVSIILEQILLCELGFEGT